MLRIIVFSLIILVIVPSSIFAIGGDRKGFTLGFALGGSYFGSSSDYEILHSNTLLIGYGLDNKNSLVFEGITTMKDSRIANFSTIRYYHFFKNGAPSPFATLGIGNYTNESGEYTLKILMSDSDDFALTVGGGFEFNKRVLIGVCFSQAFKGDSSIYQISGLISLFAY